MAGISQSATLNNDLKQAFLLTEQDLKANRAGFMTEIQQAYLAHKRRDFIKAFAGFITMSTIMGLVFLFTSSTSRGQSTGFLGLCLTVGFCIYARMKLAQMSRDAAQNQVVSVQGRIKRRHHGRKPSRHYFVYVEKQSFEIPQAVHEILMDGKTYLVYYTPHSKTLVAAEYIGS
jgi:hypothetical protein